MPIEASNFLLLRKQTKTDEDKKPLTMANFLEIKILKDHIQLMQI